jgi:fused signal recognition particle receptor
VFGRKSSIGEALAKTRRMLRGRIQTIFGAGDITEETWETLEETLIQADVGAGAAIELVERLRKRVADGEVTSAQGVEALLKEEMLAVLRQDAPHADEEPRLLTVVLVVGVNGSGKTTSVAKLARYYTQKGHKVMLAAADTFRAAAIDQLRIWAERAGVAIVAHQPNSDPGAVV